MCGGMLPLMSDKLPPDPIAERRDEVLKRMMNTPPKPRAKPKADTPSSSRKSAPKRSER
jgi:hypothetical protein